MAGKFLGWGGGWVWGAVEWGVRLAEAPAGSRACESPGAQGGVGGHDGKSGVVFPSRWSKAPESRRYKARASVLGKGIVSGTESLAPGTICPL